MEKTLKSHNKVFWETIIITILLVLPFFTPLKGSFIFAPIVYLLVERFLRKRTFEEIGFNLKKITHDVLSNWKLIIFVSVVLNVLTVIFAQAFVPKYFEYVMSRVSPMLSFQSFGLLIIQFLILGLLEEIAFRGFLQGRLSWFIKPYYAIIITSAIFAMLHYFPGELTVVGFSLFSVFINSLFYGLIFLRTNNIFASWIAHVLVNLAGVIILLSLGAI